MSKYRFFSFVPNTITSLNVLSGSLSIAFAFEGNLLLAGIFILSASVFDFLDGMSARLLNAYSEMGKELDSLADMISFGLAPAVIAHRLVRLHYPEITTLNGASVIQLIVIFSPFIIVILSALRLAKFNIDTRQTDSFIGLPTPSNAMVWASFAIMVYLYPESQLSLLIQKIEVIIPLSFILSILLVSEIPMFSLKFKSLTFAENKIRYIFLIVSAVLLFLFSVVGIAVIIFWYIILSLIVLVFSSNN